MSANNLPGICSFSLFDFTSHPLLQLLNLCLLAFLAEPLFLQLVHLRNAAELSKGCLQFLVLGYERVKRGTHHALSDGARGGARPPPSSGAESCLYLLAFPPDLKLARSDRDESTW